MILIAGLGNPGKEYIDTRHNIGFLVIDNLLDSFGVSCLKRKFKAKYCEIAFEDKKIIALKPQTFMNESGLSIASAKKFYGQELNRILIIHDDIDLPLGSMKFKRNGGTAGHNGLNSIKKHIKTDQFDRLRFGVGRPSGLKSAAGYVLKNFKKIEKKEVDILLENSVQAIKDYIISDIEFCMNKYN